MQQTSNGLSRPGRTEPDSIGNAPPPPPQNVEAVYLRPFLHQVGGSSALLMYDEKTVCKRLRRREYQFYCNMPDALKPFVPRYKGAIDVKWKETPDGCIQLYGYRTDRSSAISKRSQSEERLSVSRPSAGCPSDGLPKTKSSSILFRRTDSGSIEVFKRLEKENSRESCTPESDRWLHWAGRCGGFHETGKSADSLVPHSDDEMAPVGRTRASAAQNQSDEPCEWHLAGAGGSLTSLDKKQLTTSNDGSQPAAVHQMDADLVFWNLRCQKKSFLQLFNEKAGQSNNSDFILLENVASPFHWPSILDLKLGTRQYGHWDSAEKRQRKKNRCRESTSQLLGLRVCGMQVFRADGSYRSLNKYDGRVLDVDGFKRVLSDFFFDGVTVRRHVIPAFVKQLTALEKALKDAQSSARLYASSLLLLYESNARTTSQTETTSDLDPVLVDVRLIDFAQTHFIDCEEEASSSETAPSDGGLLFGLRTLIGFLQRILFSDHSLD